MIFRTVLSALAIHDGQLTALQPIETRIHILAVDVRTDKDILSQLFTMVSLKTITALRRDSKSKDMYSNPRLIQKSSHTSLIVASNTFFQMGHD